ncbi:hypothetical protein BWQ96_09221 [Gracilariopsis chorda]|uniref:Uncharacterized protein n=1 Tax=Gracilariopsis chorda TaxID=448386 RepID=A0A2V3IG36_9FLOR|nr:hypothetical protein BWQ96_09221 [Gracilariopsis chorda]|eukprot:PXF41056.1 hypothetical protein BWQ96_09221 [Gracilariopsis chorda]
MLLLENAKIKASVYSSIIIRLVSTIALRSKISGNKIFVVSRKRLEALKINADNLLNILPNNGNLRKLEEKHTHEAKEIIEAVSATIDANERRVNQDRTILRITFDDAVELLKDLKFEDKEKTNTDSDAISMGIMLGKREYNDHVRQGHCNNPNRDKKPKSYVPN